MITRVARSDCCPSRNSTLLNFTGVLLAKVMPPADTVLGAGCGVLPEKSTVPPFLFWEDSAGG